MPSGGGFSPRARAGALRPIDRSRGAARAAARAGAMLGAAMLLGCNGGRPPGSVYARLQHDDPDVRIEAILEAASTKDTKALPYLVDRLGDCESDVRFFAAVALKEQAGEAYRAMGWNYYDPPGRRAEAMSRWREWLRQRHGGPGGPSSQPACGPRPEPRAAPEDAAHDG